MLNFCYLQVNIGRKDLIYGLKWRYTHRPSLRSTYEIMIADDENANLLHFVLHYEKTCYHISFDLRTFVLLRMLDWY